MGRPSFVHCPLCGAKLTMNRIEDRVRMVCPDCNWIHYENPFPCAAAFVRNSKDEILLVKRGIEPGKGKWALPSGFMEIDETPEEACLRELEEETGMKGNILRLIGIYSQESLTYSRVLIVGYEVEATGIPVAGSDSIEARFFPEDKLPEIVFSSHRRLIQDALNQKVR